VIVPQCQPADFVSPHTRQGSACLSVKEDELIFEFTHFKVEFNWFKDSWHNSSPVII
jgi:hypothetical protein